MPYQRDLEILHAYGEFLKEFRWQLFCTFTFAWPVSDVQADRVFKAFIDRLEAKTGGCLGYVRGDEKRFSGCGMPASPRHFHVLMTSETYLDPGLVSTT